MDDVMVELRGMTDEQLLESERECRNELLGLNTVAAKQGYGRTKTCTKNHFYSIYRKQIDRIQTVMNERKKK